MIYHYYDHLNIIINLSLTLLIHLKYLSYEHSYILYTPHTKPHCNSYSYKHNIIFTSLSYPYNIINDNNVHIHLLYYNHIPNKYYTYLSPSHIYISSLSIYIPTNLYSHLFIIPFSIYIHFFFPFSCTNTKLSKII